ncbi:MAG: zinc dependent phospholipase C family protein, partial [Planctomycetales bacterium]|nr:zinc dependent phospholipase C family protein [Planctomycetales bacterium]
MSSLLFRVVFAQECTSTHHKLAMDALQQLRDEQAPAWRDMLLYYFDAYLDGSKAPDKKFKDFRNHVLHVGENFWGGAVERCNHWYGETVQLLREKKWREAAYAAGVLSHYFTDPLMPFHTGQSEEETQIHRAVEWSITKSYDRLRAILVNELGGFPVVDAPRGDDWLAQMVKQGARKAHAHYQMMIDHYDFAIGVADPPAALDQEIKDAIAELLGHAAVGFARVLDRAFADAAVQPPTKRLTLGGYLSLLTIPIAWVERKLADGRDRAIVKAMYGEFKKSGRVRESLPEDDRAVRQAHADEVLKRPLEEIEAAELRPIGSKHGTGKPSR